MNALHLLKIFFLCFLFFVTNINLLHAKEKDFSNEKCDFHTGKYLRELSNIASV